MDNHCRKEEDWIVSKDFVNLTKYERLILNSLYPGVQRTLLIPQLQGKR
jgi:hypothetical protein